MRIACVGGGPAGLYFAILMKASDSAHEVTVFERNPPGVTYGWGVVFWDDLVEQLQASDPATANEIGASSFRWNGQLLAVESKPPVHVGGHGYGIGRQRLLDILVERAMGLGVRVEFESSVEDPELPEADLIVACDGVNSRLRELRREELQTDVLVGPNKYIWLGTSRVFDVFTFALSTRMTDGSGVTPTASTAARARSSPSARRRRGRGSASTRSTRPTASTSWRRSSSGTSRATA